MDKKRIFILIILNLVLDCVCVKKTAVYRCEEDQAVPTNIITTLRILPNDDDVHSVYAFRATGSVTDPGDRIDACTEDSSGITDPFTEAIEFVIPIDTTAATHDCGAVLTTEVIDGVTVTFVEFKFYVYAAANLVSDEGATLSFTCKSTDLDNNFVSTPLLDVDTKPPIRVPRPQPGVYLNIRDADTKRPMTTTTVGDRVFMSLDYVPALKGGNDNCGTLFYIGFLGNDVIGASTTSAADLYIQVVPVYPKQTDVLVTAGDEEFEDTAYSGEPLYFEIDVALMGCSADGEVEKDLKGIEVKSFDMKVCVNVFNIDADTEEYYTAIPLVATGTQYAIASMDLAELSELMIVGSEDTTTANIHLPAGAPSITYDSTTYNAGDTLTLELNKRETLHMCLSAGFSGFRVTLDKPGSVIIGAQNFEGNHLEEQLPPIDRVGIKYVLVYTGWLTTYTVTATVTGEMGMTTVKQFTGTDTFTSHYVTYGGTPLTIDIEEATQCEIEANFPILVIMVPRPTGDSTFQPAMVVVPSVFQWAPEYRIGSPGNTRNVKLLIIQKNAVSLTGRTLTDVTNLPLPTNTILGPNGYVADIEIALPSDLWTVYSTDNISPFMVYAMTLSTTPGEDTSALYLPFNLRYAIYLSCVKVGSAGDGKDNDCDGLIDEELLNQIDDDFDGIVDEDLVKIAEDILEYAGVVAVRPINCKVSAESTFPDDDQLTTQLTGADGCPADNSRAFTITDNWQPKTPENGEEIGDADEIKVQHSGVFLIAMYFGYSKLYFMCETLSCRSTSETACTTAICQPDSRRKRQSESEEKGNVTSEVWVNAFGNKETGVTNTAMGSSEPSVRDCLQNSAIQAAGGLMLGLSLVSIFAACCFCFMLRSRWKSKKRRNKHPPSSRISTIWTKHSRRY